MRSHRAWAAVAFAIAWLVYFASPIHTVYDSRYSTLVSEALWRHGTFDVGPMLPPELRAAESLPYQLGRVGEHVYYTYPPGTPVLTVPFIAAFDAIGLRTLAGDGHFDSRGEARAQRLIAATFAAGAAALLMVVFLRFTTPARAIVLCAAVAFGSPFWSTASRALWSQTTDVLLLAATLVVMTGASRGWRRGLIVGTLVGWMYATRPTAAISIASILAFEMLRDRRSAGVAAIVAVGWLAAFVTWSLRLYGLWRPPYYAASLSLATFGEAAAGQLASPSRGLLIFSPCVLAAVYLLARYGRRVADRRLLYVAVAAIVGHFLLIAAWPMWWFGHSFGPRAWLDVVPWFGVLAALAMGAAPAAFGRVARVRGAAVLLWSIAVHAEGAWFARAARWNAAPLNVDQHPERLWDWRDAQWRAAWRS